ncbi:MAG TPA: isoprenylcysteine carboxylmethyltransferase family protein [Ancylobacter sp.]
METILILGFVTLQRLGELVLSNRNTARLLAQGAREVGREHYPYMVALHALWLAGLWWLAPGRPVSLALLIVYVLLQILRVWVIASLGGRWTTRIIVLPRAPLVRRGPYRFLSHPNYVVVAAEIAVLPLMFGLIGYAVLFSVLNAIVLYVRIRAENAALGIGTNPVPE